uniref:Aminopeptidase n=1 Tax=Gouania willdenowi TaxID=441366 RepID=A0A8C5EFS3_GOUWI
MPNKSSMSKAFAAAFAVLTISIISGIITLTILYKSEINILNPTPPPTFSPTTTAPPPDSRLPTNLVPESYEIFLQPWFHTRIIEMVNVTSPNQTMLFTGNSTVHFHCTQAARSIYLHSMDLTLSNPWVMNQDTNEQIGVSDLEQQEDVNDFLKVNLEEDLMAGGNYSLFLAFEGEVSASLEGLYECVYIEGYPKDEDDENALRFLVATNMEPTHARMLFPCFDEPAMKAEFHLTIIHRRTTSALGNTAILGERRKKYVIKSLIKVTVKGFNSPSFLSVSNIIDDEWKYTQFYPTPRMSTYLFAFAVSEFTSIPSSHERVEIKTYARPEATEKGHTKYAAHIAGSTLTFFEKLFEIDYTLGKLDQIALPDLASLAMENWGLITYVEGSLLFEEGVSSLLHKEDIAIIVAHELAHQWFGNLVTIKWWSDLWLKEGFATYFSFPAVDYVEPTFKMKDVFMMETLHFAFEADALTSSHPLSSRPEDVQTIDDIRQMYDSITYNKGASVLRMLADFVGENVFNNGIKVSHTLAISIAKLMDPWVNQIGYPVITINTTSGEIYQKHFLFNNTAESRYVPEIQRMGKLKKEEFISKSGEWILVNVNSTGYYRVNYNPENWERLLTQLERDPQRIPPINRGQLIDDVFNLARAKLVNVTLALNFTRFLSKERAYLPWDSAVKNLEYFVIMFDRCEVYGPIFKLNPSTVFKLCFFSLRHNQITAIDVACSNGLPECIEMAKSKFSNWMRSNSTNNIHPNLRSMIYCHAVAAGGKEEWEFAWDKYQSSRDTSEREYLQYAMSCTKKIWLLNRYLKYTLDSEKIRFRDVASTISFIAMNAAGQALAWNFIRAHWGTLIQFSCPLHLGNWLILSHYGCHVGSSFDWLLCACLSRHAQLPITQTSCDRFQTNSLY